MAVSVDPSKSDAIAMASDLASQQVCSYVAMENNNFEELLLAMFADPSKLPSKLQSPPAIAEPELTPLPENTTTPSIPYNGPDIDTKLIDDPLSNTDLRYIR